MLQDSALNIELQCSDACFINEECHKQSCGVVNPVIKAVSDFEL